MLHLHQEILQDILVRYQVFTSKFIIRLCFQEYPANFLSRGFLVRFICSQMLPCPTGLKTKVLREIILSLFLSWKALMDVNTGLQKTHRNSAFIIYRDSNSSRIQFLYGEFFCSEMPLVSLTRFMLGPWLIIRAFLSWRLLLGPGRKLQVISSKCWCM